MGFLSRRAAVLNWPNRISLLRLLMVGPFIVLMMNQNEAGWHWARHAALGIFLAMAISDFLDGFIARRMNIRTRLGAILDPLADKVLIVCSVVLLSLPDFAIKGATLPNWVVVAVVGKDLYVVAGFFVIYLVTDKFRVRPMLAGKACTCGQLAMVLAALLAPDLNAMYAGVGTHVAAGCQWAVAVLVAMAMISYTRLGLSYVAEGQKPLDEHPRPKQ